MSQRREIKNIISGFFLLLLFHLAAVILILGIAALTQSSYNLSLSIIVYGIYGFSLWQLIYVIPLSLWLKNKGKISVMKGVITAAIITFLVYVGCFLLVVAFIIR
ncbi:MAG: hypothetical protein KME60_10015 [Cyanomargarita calcarea GSE-NOS-MK-12-04C]|jgi:hypothetical protein|uniref:Uncharacterized protein n=1 Tax=Cyanomargarita calcarea GSE-NOS-MK-12-04C TaxID=2839659 RepID=A0A951URP4_9CYAN|nr:hypothetical protein [Cyanomargarita calcarea GSE-NOS-MK-12-04C]